MTSPGAGHARQPLGPAVSALCWALIGAAGLFGIAALLTIGIFVLVGAAGLAAVAIALKADRRALPALCLGAAVTPFSIAWLNRHGPGNICTAIDNGIHCEEQFDPWSFVLTGTALLALGAVLLAVTMSRAPRKVLPDPPFPPPLSGS